MWQSLKGVHSIAMLATPEDFATEGNKVVWLEFKDIYEVYHQDALNTDLIVAWCLKVASFLCFLIKLLRMWIY
jgi:hypothetical protein